MSIFKETFRDYVRDQLSIRDKVISRGNSGTEKGATLPRRNQSSTVKLQSGKEITLDPGAFYSLFNRQCVIRMTSMTDYVEDVGLDIGINNEDGTRSNSTFASIKGGTLAQNFILQGGVLSDFARNVKGESRPKRVTTPRDGFPRPGQKTSLSYGDGGIVSDATSDGYGIVPMPGIIDANIRTKSAYGSLREAKVNFVCHNQRQLEVLEMLYMRPGYAVLLEWGWSPYVGNDGKLVNKFKTVEDDISQDVLFSNKVTQQTVFNSINRLKEASFGNYDGMLGYIKNFGFQARSDGGFDCYVELISIGEVLDSIKTINSNKINQLDPNQPLTYYNALTGLIKGLSILTQNETQFEQNTQEIKETLYKEQYGNSWGPVVSFLIKFSTVGQVTDALITSAAKNYINVIGTNIQETLISLLSLKDSSELNNFVIKAGTNSEVSLGDFTLWTTSFKNQFGFIRWDALCSLINYQFIPKDTQGNPPFFISPDRVVLKNSQIYLEPLLYTAYNSTQGLIEVSCDPNICILPNQFNYEDQKTAGQVQNSLGYVPQVNRWAPLSGLGPFLGSNGVQDIIYNSSIGEKSLKEEKDTWGENLLDFNDSYRRIGNIFININMLYELAINNLNNLDYTLGQFIKDIWNKINQACPNHNFQLVDNKDSSIINVIDLGVSNTELPLTDKLYEFIPFSNENTLREFSFESQVPSSLTATIAIQAQDPRSIENIEDVTFIAFNRSIKNRLVSSDETSKVEQIQADSQKQQQLREEVKTRLKEKKDLWESISEYINDFWEILSETSNQKIDNINISGNIKKYQALIEASKIENLENTASTSVIPLSFNATMDGISGIVIGNVFKIQKDRLPKAYKKANIGFIVFGEDQQITPGQNWITKINGKMVILPTKNKKITQVQPLQNIPNENTFANVTQTELNKPFVAESTGVNMSAAVAQVQQSLGISSRPLPNPTVSQARAELLEKGYTIWVPTGTGFRAKPYELYYKKISENNFEIKYIITKGQDKGAVINYANQLNIDDKTKFDIEGRIIATPGSL
jgi:hypothetical protein